MEGAEELTLSISIERSRGCLNVYVRGELDIASAPKLVQAVADEIGNHVSDCVLDFRGVTFIDSEAIKSLIVLRRKLRENGTNLAIVNVNYPVTRILSLVDPSGETGWDGAS